MNMDNYNTNQIYVSENGVPKNALPMPSSIIYGQLPHRSHPPGSVADKMAKMLLEQIKEGRHLPEDSSNLSQKPTLEDKFPQ